jgi:ABC-type Mn2+/Zn2+ transport system permease subunit
MMVIAVLLGVIISVLGMSLSFFLNWPPGATIALTATALYLFNLIRRKG